MSHVNEYVAAFERRYFTPLELDVLIKMAEQQRPVEHLMRVINTLCSPKAVMGMEIHPRNKDPWATVPLNSLLWTASG